MNQKPFFVIIFTFAVFAIFIAFISNRNISAPTMIVDRPALHCNKPPTFKISYKREDNGVIPMGQGFNFQGLSWIEADLCSSGTLQITAEGQRANGQNPILDIALDSELLAEEAFNRRRSISVQILRSGHLTLGYFNDFYLAESRIAFIQDIRFSGMDCNGVSVDVPAGTGGLWDSTHMSTSLVTDIPITIKPCSEGILSLKVSGRASNNIYPLLEIQQQGKQLQIIQTGQDYVILHLKVDAKRLKIVLVNPYFKQIADRNLMVNSIKFISH